MALAYSQLAGKVGLVAELRGIEVIVA